MTGRRAFLAVKGNQNAAVVGRDDHAIVRCTVEPALHGRGRIYRDKGIPRGDRNSARNRGGCHRSIRSAYAESVQEPLATEKFTVPAVPNLLTNKRSVAFAMPLPVVPEGNVERSNCTRPLSDGGPADIDSGRRPEVGRIAASERTNPESTWHFAQTRQPARAPLRAGRK